MKAVQKYRPHIVLLTLSIILSSCSHESKTAADEAAWGSVKTSNSHFDYARYIQAYPYSSYVDSAITSYFFYRDSLWDVEGVPMGDCFNNCASIILGPKGWILFEAEFATADSLYDLALIYLQNKNRDPFMSDRKEVKIPYSEESGIISQGHFEYFLSPDSLHPVPLQEAVIPISRAINSYKDTVALQWYHQDYDQLPMHKQQALDSILGLRFIFFKHHIIPPPIDTQETDEIMMIEDFY